jgi:hypothetical protein
MAAGFEFSFTLVEELNSVERMALKIEVAGFSFTHIE